MICSVCSNGCQYDHTYLGHYLCYDCYKNQIGHYLYDKYPEDLSEEEEEEVMEWVEDHPHT
tara:strand:+ start:92 stop:274 length:183 start_codon:yes stop_codon:yes gene_type:complete